MTLADTPPPSRRALRAARMEASGSAKGPEGPDKAPKEPVVDGAPAGSGEGLIDSVPDAATPAHPASDADRAAATPPAPSAPVSAPATRDEPFVAPPRSAPPVGASAGSVFGAPSPVNTDSGPLGLEELFGLDSPEEAPATASAPRPHYSRTSAPEPVFAFTASAAPVSPTAPADSVPAAEPTLTMPPAVEPHTDAVTAPETLPAGGDEEPPDRKRIALAWVDETTVALGGRVGPDLATATSPYVPVENDLLADPPRRSPFRPGVLVPAGVTAAFIGAYAATTLLWPLHAVAPTVESIQVDSVPAAATAMPWPGAGSAAVAVRGVGTAASSADAVPMASITKIVTALVVLEEMPLAPGEQGPEFRFGWGDRNQYWNYRWNGESALDVPVGGTLTQYQLLEGMLIGSANNYADRLAGNLWPSDAVFANAAMRWLTAHGVEGITVVEPTGMDPGNTATPESLLVLADKALANPVIAEIVAKPSVELPGAGLVENTNGLLADPGVIGIKTGTLDTWNLLSAKNLTIGDTTVRVTASVLGQPDDATRLEASRALYAQLEQELQPRPSVNAGTTAGIVQTKWGEQVDIVTAADAGVILWNGGVASVSSTFSLGDSREKGDTVGTLSVEGPLNSTEVELELAEEIEGPSAWWRLTHPLELFGLSG